MTHTIKQFMWGYQRHFRVCLECLGKKVFETIGIDLQPVVLLVGARKPGSNDPNSVCIEPEDGECSIKEFDGLLENIERTIKQHPMQNMLYGDEPRMSEKPEHIRRDSVKEAVSQALKAYDQEKQLRSLCGTACPVGEFYVVPVIQLPVELFDEFPPLREPIGDKTISVHLSFIHAVMQGLLSEATEDLKRKDPGRDRCEQMRSAREIAKIAAEGFMHIPAVAIGKEFTFGLFERLNMISSLFYEGTQGQGRILLVDSENPDIEWILKFTEPVPFEKIRWARKMLQLATTDPALVVEGNAILGLGNIADDYDASKQDVFTIDFLEHYQWHIKCGEDVLLTSRYGEPRLLQKKISKEQFTNNFCRLFHQADKNDEDRLWDIFMAAKDQAHGSMLVVAEDAATEAKRLARQGTTVQPTLMTPDILRRVSKIDGTIILDPHGCCHAIGVILDGPANEKCTPARGARYNSGVRYVEATETPRLAIVVSEDRTVDIIPLLRPQIFRTTLQKNITALENATLEDYHQPRLWLDEHRFYLNTQECNRVNMALDRLDNLPLEVGQIYIQTVRFTPNPKMNDTYLLPDS